MMHVRPARMRQYRKLTELARDNDGKEDALMQQRKNWSAHFRAREEEEARRRLADESEAAALADANATEMLQLRKWVLIESLGHLRGKWSVGAVKELEKMPGVLAAVVSMQTAARAHVRPPLARSPRSCRGNAKGWDRVRSCGARVGREGRPWSVGDACEGGGDDVQRRTIIKELLWAWSTNCEVQLWLQLWLQLWYNFGYNCELLWAWSKNCELQTSKGNGGGGEG